MWEKRHEDSSIRYDITLSRAITKQNGVRTHENKSAVTTFQSIQLKQECPLLGTTYLVGLTLNIAWPKRYTY